MSQKSKYENKNPFHQYALRRFLGHIQNAIDEIAAVRILEIGSAEGYLMKYLKDRNRALELCGIDIDLSALGRAQKMNPEMRFEYGDLEMGVMPKERFDVVTAPEVFEHIRDSEKALLNMQKLNAKFFLISVPHEPFFRILNFMRGRHWKRLGNHPEHIHAWNKSDFKELLGKYFTIEKDYSSFPWTIFLATKKGY